MDQLGKREESQQGLVQAMWQCWWSRSFGNVAGIKPRPLVESLDPPWRSDPNTQGANIGLEVVSGLVLTSNKH